QVAVCLEERVPVLSLFWGDPAPYVVRAHAAGVTVMHQVGSVAAARRAAAAGVDVIVAQGVEAGGHVEGKVGTMVLVPRVVDAVAPTPVAAAGSSSARTSRWWGRRGWGARRCQLPASCRSRRAPTRAATSPRWRSTPGRARGWSAR